MKLTKKKSHISSYQEDLLNDWDYYLSMKWFNFNKFYGEYDPDLQDHVVGYEDSLSLKQLNYADVRRFKKRKRI